MSLENIKGKTIVVTRGVKDSLDSFLKLEEYGAKIIHFPTLEYKPIDDWREFDSVIVNKDKIDYLIFTSANSVIYFAARCRKTNTWLDFERTKVISIGKKTAEECHQYNIPVNIIPEKFSAGGILKSLSDYEIKDKSFFIPGSEIAHKELPETLSKYGAKVITTAIYRIELPSQKIIDDNMQLLDSVKPDLFIFTSPSTFKNFLAIRMISEPKNYFDGFIIAAIGPATKEEIENHNIKVTIVPHEHTTDGLTKEIINYYTNKN
jgi:uroporphyrinogen-III synthase